MPHMAFHKELVVPPYYVQMDTENIISLLVLIGLGSHFYFAFGRLIQQGGEKQYGGRMSYGNAAAA